MRYLSLLVVVLVACACTGAFAEEMAAPPDANVLFEQTRITENRVLYQTGFEEENPPQWSRSYAGVNAPSQVTHLGVTDEQAHSGKRSYKLQVHFEAGGESQAAYFVLPFAIPRWSEVKARFYIKMDQSQAPQKIHIHHGLFNGIARKGWKHMNVKGLKTGMDNGWEVWETTVPRAMEADEWINGASIRFTLVPPRSPESTVTIYVDDVEVIGKVPPNYEEKWEEVYEYYTVFHDKHMRDSGTRRLAAMRKRYRELKSAYTRATLPEGTSALLEEQYDACCEKIDKDLPRTVALMDAIQKGLDDKETPFAANVNAPERILNDLGFYVGLAQTYPADVAGMTRSDCATFTLDMTMSYAILPTGPEAHNEEPSYLSWNGRGIENPQLLPDAKPVPASPSRTMKGFGCRGTDVPLSFAILPEKTLEAITFDVSDLECKAGTISRDAVDIRYVATWWRSSFGVGKVHLANELLLYDPEFTVPLADKKENVYKDARHGNDAETLQPVTIPAGTVRQFYVLVSIPEDAPAGTYQGNITAMAKDASPIVLDVELEVLPFDLEPTPYAYSFFYPEHVDESILDKEKGGTHNRKKTFEQMEEAILNMGQHGLNTLCLYDGRPTKTKDGWDLSRLGKFLDVAKHAGLTRSPFVWLGHPISFTPQPGREGFPQTTEEMLQWAKEFPPLANAWCDENGYPRPAFFGVDEAAGERLMRLKKMYQTIIDAGGIVTVACFIDFWEEIGPSLNLPIVYNGAGTVKGRRGVRNAQKLGYECWTYNAPATNIATAPSTYRRRYGLAMWRNGEDGAIPWAYTPISNKLTYTNVREAQRPSFMMAWPTWSGRPIDTVIYEAFREGIYDTRYMTTLEKALARAKEADAARELVAKAEKWLETFSVNDDLQKVRRQLADFIVALSQ